MRYMRPIILAVCLIFQGLLLISPASAEIKQVDGDLWLNSSPAERRAYLVGVANVIQVHEALKLKRGEATEDAAIVQMLKAMDANSIETVMENIDAWYESRPDQLGTPVLGVVWLRFVEAATSQ